MKFLFLTVLFSVSALASEVSFKCDFSELTAVSQFSIEATKVQYDDGKFSNVEFDFTLRKAGFTSSAERLVVTRDGSAETVNAGINPRFKAVRLTSSVKGAEVEHINLLIGTAPQYSSQIRLLNGMTYFGTCQSL